MSKKMLRFLVLAGCLSLAAWPSAVAAPATDNLIPIFSGPGTPRCHNDPDGGDGRLTCQTDNAAVTWYMDSGGAYELEEPDRADVRHAITYEFQPTTLLMKYDSTPTFSGSAETDIIYQEGSTNIGPGTDGVTWCNDESSSSPSNWRCDQQYIRIRGAGVYNTRITCHETGHAIGLTHGPQANPDLGEENTILGCMTNPPSTFDLGSSNTLNINAEWDAP